MRVGLDLDGLLDERPDCFAFLTRALRAQGHFVGSITHSARRCSARSPPRTVL